MKYLLPLFATFALVGCDETIDSHTPNTPPSIENPIEVVPDIPVEGEEEGVVYYFESDDGAKEFIKNGIAFASRNANDELLDITGRRIGSAKVWNNDSNFQPTGLILTFDERFYFDGIVFEPSYEDSPDYMSYHFDRDVWDGSLSFAPMQHD
ncbi:hypothetical protein JCM19241_5302 [Vibrio ishigakensis]|uniref:Lipoprotein n=1 Tax=Vibrio ishigakensis TaxID=1481914 RepID=A0A0B8Q6A8_9VIBR|nr:hypothetical protein JCM19241_5302 [Vibrio ishigakensis]